jgi:hypothetical protein
MRTRTRLFSILELVMIGAAITAITAITANAAAGPAEPSERFSGSLVNTVAGAHFSQPFILAVDRYASQSDVQRLTGILADRGAYSLRDELWKRTAGYLSVGGGLGRPIAAVFSQDTPTGRTIHVLMNRPLLAFETQYYTRSSKYPFTVVELNLDKNGQGSGRLIGAAKLQMHGDTLEIESLGIQPIHLLAVRAAEAPTS